MKYGCRPINTVVFNVNAVESNKHAVLHECSLKIAYSCALQGNVNHPGGHGPCRVRNAKRCAPFARAQQVAHPTVCAGMAAHEPYLQVDITCS